MATTIEISYFNSYWIKSVSRTGGGGNNATWPNGYPYNTGSDALPLLGGGTLADFPGNAADQSDYDWFVEESRIRGGYNNTQTDLGVRAFIVEEENIQQHRFNSMIYSGIYNSRTGINQTNQFSAAEDIIKSLDPANGSIQKLFAENTNMTIFQQSKVSSALIDKDAVYTAEGSPMQTTSNVVIGQVQPYLGEYGISENPESFAVYGFQKYFTDKDRGVVLRLSRDGITEISQYGMLDYFRDNLATISNKNLWQITTGNTTETNSGNAYMVDVYGADISKMLSGVQLIVDNEFSGYVKKIEPNGTDGGSVTIDRTTSITAGQTVYFQAIAPGKILGGYDIHNKNYTLSIQTTPAWQENTDSPSNYATLTFDELVKGWSSFFTYKPTFVTSLKNKFYSFKNGSIYQHYSNPTGNNRGAFYGSYAPSNITFIFNENSSVSKNFQTVNYEGDNGWQVTSFTSDAQRYDYVNNGWVSYDDTTAQVPSYNQTYNDGGVIYRLGFDRKENKYFANLVNNSPARDGEVVWGNEMSGIKGYFATVTFSTDALTDVGGAKELWSVGSNFVVSSY